MEQPLNENVEQVLILGRKELRHNLSQDPGNLSQDSGNLSQDAGDLSQEEDDMDTMMASLADPDNEKCYTIYLYLYNI